ncbi:Ankyrin repeats (3 copies) [Popillia japonica]|uniref:Ankyrin repeats (3 copies) n=1 Tax=Popillia japonica TaxID=7064 RepID=A0AAW1JZE3_POPJA
MASGMKQLPKCEIEKKFLTAAEEKNYAVVSECLKQGVNPNARKKDRVTALHIAAERGDIDLAKLLLRARGLNMNPFTIHAYTPLIIACHSQQAPMIEFLLENGADVDIPERFGKAAVHHAAFIDSLQIMDILIKHGANVNIIDVFSHTPLSIAVVDIKHGANVNIIDVFSHTPLSIAVVDRHYLPMVEFLVNRGASITLNREACLVCCSEKHLEVIEYLLLVGTNPNTKELRTNRNAFHYFAINGYLPLARLLEKWGTDVLHSDVYYLTPLILAKQHDNLDAVDFLEDLEMRQRRTSRSQSVTNPKAVTFGI